MHRLTLVILVIFMLALTKNVGAQAVKDSLGRDSITMADTLKLADTAFADSAAVDTVAKQSLEQRLGIRISPDALPAVVTAQAADSAVLDMHNDIFYLYGKAQVNYEDMQLNAGKLTYYQAQSLVTAVPEFDTAGGAKERPSFAQGQEKFTYDTLQYNFKSKRAIVRNARSQYGEGYVYSEQVKRNPDQSLYGYHSTYTTCALDTPHFGIFAWKIKIVPNRVIASGPANLNIGQVPTPLFLPFGLFPIAQGHKSGFRLPTYTIEERRGLGLLNGGYYFYLNDYVDLLLQGNIYSKGSWLLSGVSTYTNRYHYSGAFNFSYAYEKTGEEFEPTATQRKDFLINWRHQSDPKSRPGVNFNASVDAGTGSFYQNNTYDINQITKNQMQSNVTLTKAWQNKPYTMTVAARHSQNTVSGDVDVTLPELTFYVAQFNPFQGRNATGTRWYEKITASYNFSARNTIHFIDSTFSLNKLSGTDFRNGAVHSIPIGATYNVFRFFQLTLGAKYTEYWLTRQQYRYYNSEIGAVDTIDNSGFYTARDFTTDATVSTRIYGLKTFRRGKLAGIRHVLNPSLGIGYLPDYSRAPFLYGYRTILDPSGVPVYASPYDASVVGVPGLGNFGKFSSNLTYSLNNNLQIKVRTNDSIGSKNITLIDGLRIGGSYNIAADSFKWSPVVLDFRTNVLNILNISAGATFDPYVYDFDRGRRIDRTYIDAGRGLARFTSGNITASANLHSLKTGEPAKQKAANSEEVQRMMQFGRYNDYADFNVPWNLTLNYSLTATKRPVQERLKDTVEYVNSIVLVADFNLTSRWKFMINSTYNFTTKQVSGAQLQLIRDLHCWEMRLSTIPIGPNKMYFFTINVKAQVLQDLKMVRRRDFRDSQVF